jgi:hypothetical protein
MRHCKFLAAAAIALCGFSSVRAASYADTHAGFYLANRPGNFVQYLSLSDSGASVGGFLEAIRATTGTPDGQTRLQTFARTSGSSLSFGGASATRTSDGYTLTWMTPEGKLAQQHFVRSSVGAVNAAIAALAASVSRNRAQSDIASSRAQWRTYTASAGDDTARLGRAQAALDAATAAVSDAQRAQDRLTALSKKALADANAAIDKPGVSLAINQERIAAMRTADDAEQSVVAAQRSFDIATSALDVAKAEVARLRGRIADSTERARALAAHLGGGETYGP